MKWTSVRKNGQVFEKMDMLKYFIEEPEREFHLREIARLAGVSPSTVSKHLSELSKSGTVVCTSNRGLKLFRANTGNFVYRDAKLFYNLSRLRESGMIEHLTAEFNHPKSIVLFGSFRKSDNVAGSDIDIFIQTPLKKDPDLSRFEKSLGHPVQLFLASDTDVERMKKKNKELLNNILNGIVLEGFFEVFR